MRAKSNVAMIFRSILSFAVGLFAASLITEIVEFLAVAALHGGFVTEETPYLQIRNQPLFLAAKLVYTGLSGFTGGYLAAWIAGRARLAHGVAVAAAQAVSLIWAGLLSPMSSTAPLWLWLSLIVLVPAMILLGARQRARSEDAPTLTSTAT